MLRPRSIDYIRHKIKAWAEILDRKDVYAVCTVIFVGISSFLIGRLSFIDDNRPPVTIEQFSLEAPQPVTTKALEKPSENPQTVPTPVPASQTAGVAASTGSKGLYVGSRTSNKYHLPHCSGAQRISEANKIWFATKSDAEKAGYVPAGNCKGI